MVNIIMPAYNGHNTIRQAIASICMQKNIEEIKLTIVDDNSDEPYDYLLNDYKYIDINILKKHFNSGCGQSRQYGIDHTDCAYFMFLDTDDTLYSFNSVSILLNAIKNIDCDVVISDFIEEKSENEYMIYKNSDVWMHGKIYNTEYIKNNNIRFNETRSNEDSAFNAIIKYSGGTIQYIDDITYIWKNNSGSLTRKSNYLYDSMNEFIINGEYAIKELLRLKSSPENILDCVYGYLISLYGYYIMFLNNNLNAKDISDYITWVQRFYKSIPTECLNNFDEEKIKSRFYNNGVINIIIHNNIIMNVGIFDFVNILKI